MGEALRCFISWAHIDFEENEWGGELVRTFKESLLASLTKSMRARGYGDVEIYLDLDNDRSGAWTAQQDAAARRAHIFLPIISQSYFVRPECVGELDSYRDAHPDEIARVIPLRAGSQPGTNHARRHIPGTSPVPPEVYIDSITPIKFVLNAADERWPRFIQEVVKEIERWDADHGLVAHDLGARRGLGESFSGLPLDKVHPWIGDESLCLWVARADGVRLTRREQVGDALPSLLSADGSRLACLVDGRVKVFVRDKGDFWTSRTLIGLEAPIRSGALMAVASEGPIRVLVHAGDDLWLLSEDEPEWITAMVPEGEVVRLGGAQPDAVNRIGVVLGGPTDVLAWNGRWYLAEGCGWDEPQSNQRLGSADAVAARLIGDELRLATYTGDHPPRLSQLSVTRGDRIELLSTQTTQKLLGLEALNGDVRLAFGYGSPGSEDSVLLQHGDAGHVVALTWTKHGLVGS